MNGQSRTDLNGFYSLAKILGAAIAGFVICMPATAQDSGAQDDTFFEEIVVTVQKREQNILDIPIAVTTMTGAQIVEAGVKDMFELQQNVPNLIVGRSQTATTSNFAIRGVGSTSNNFGVESSVGLYVDGVYRSRQGSMINDLIDIETVNVLRGPQGTLFGKNTASGAISIYSVRPTQDRNSFVDLTVGNYGLAKLSAAANFALTDNVAMRATVFGTKRDGYVEDIYLGEDALNDRDRTGIRLQLAGGELSDDFNWRLIGDYAEIDEVCCATITRVDSIYYKGSLGGAPRVGSDAAIVSLGGTAFATYDYPQPFIDAFGPNARIIQGSDFGDFQTALTELPQSTNQDGGLAFDFNKTFSNGMTLTSISGYRSFDTYDSADIDFADADLIHRTNNAEQSSFSQEFHLKGEFGEGSAWVAGVYYFTQSLDSQTTTSAGPTMNSYIYALNPALEAAVNGVNGVYAALQGSPLEPFVSPGTIPFPDGAYALDDVTQDHTSYAAFAQVDLALGDKFALTLGARYTDESKDFSAEYTQTANGPPPDLVAIATTLGAASMGDFSGVIAGNLIPISEPNVAWGSYLFDPFAPRSDLVESIDDSQSTGTAKLSFFPGDSTMLYASYSTGYKAGGTNTDRINQSFDQVFDAETSTSAELGLKGQYGHVQVVATVYQTDFEDFQANSFTGTGFNLQNAGDLSIEGVELEVTWRPWRSTEFQAFYTHNEGTYDLFENGTAWDTWVIQEGLFMNPPQGDPGCGDLSLPLPESCPRTGDPLAYNPEDRAFVAWTQDIALAANTNAFLRLEYTYASSQFTDGDLDPFSEQDDVSMLNARIGLNWDKYNTTVTLWGRNITDERWYHGSFDVPVANDKMLSYPSEPATWGLTLRMNFD